MNKNLKARAERWLKVQGESEKVCTLGYRNCPACKFESRAARIIRELMKAAK